MRKLCYQEHIKGMLNCVVLLSTIGKTCELACVLSLEDNGVSTVPPTMTANATDCLNGDEMELIDLLP
jgi:hypothetical protein